MSAAEVIRALEGHGYILAATKAGNIRLALPGGLPAPEGVQPLLVAFKEVKQDALAFLRRREDGFDDVMPTQGDVRTVSLDPADEPGMRRWALALEAGLIALDGKVRYKETAGVAVLCYRAVLPDEWLWQLTTEYARRKYNDTLVRIRVAEQWVRENGDDPAFAGFEALFVELKELACVGGELPGDPLAGYREAMP